jgi:hypothetical protein
MKGKMPSAQDWERMGLVRKLRGDHRGAIEYLGIAVSQARPAA